MILKKLVNLGITLPNLAGPFGAYVPAKRFGDLIYVAGQLPMKDGKLMFTGPVPSAVSIDDARLAARQCAVNALAAVATIPGGLETLAGVIRLGAFVLSDDAFDQQPKIANAASEFLIELFGDTGRHARAAVGVNALPLNASIEIEFLFHCA